MGNFERTYKNAINAFINARTENPDFLDHNEDFMASSKRVQEYLKQLKEKHSELTDQLFDLEFHFDHQVSVTEKIAYQNGFEDGCNMLAYLLFNTKKERIMT